jgi:hypothetical protein
MFVWLAGQDQQAGRSGPAHGVDDVMNRNAVYLARYRTVPNRETSTSFGVVPIDKYLPYSILGYLYSLMRVCATHNGSVHT